MHTRRSTKTSKIHRVSFTRSAFLSALVAVILIALARPISAQPQGMLRYAEPIDAALAAGESHEYTFEGEADDRIIITMNAKGGEVDPVLQVFDPQGRLIAEDDNSNGKRNARIENTVLPETGTYTVYAINNDMGIGGGYSLIVNEAERVLLFHGGGTADVPSSAEIPSESTGFQNYELTRPLPSSDVTYQVYNGLPGFNDADVLAIINQSFQEWANSTPLTFTQVDTGNADIRIAFDRIDGSSQVLGQACPPSSPCAGEVVFDSEENWVLAEPGQYNDISLLGVATHEFGHAVGLLHSDDASALMYPQYSPYNLRPSADDIAGVQRLYGQGQGTVYNPTPQPGAGSTGTTDEGELAVVGTLQDDEYVHFWDFDVNAGETITLSMRALSGGLDPFIILIDANDNLIAFDDDSAGGQRGFNAQIRNITLPQTGVYTVAATRYLQAQGYSEGEYQLEIIYGFVEGTGGGTTLAPATPSIATDGSVRVSRAASAEDLESIEGLDGALDGSFRDSLTPTVQTVTGTVFREQQYAWSFSWCARDQQTLNRNLASMTITFAVNGDPIRASDVTRATSQQTNLFCAVDFVLVDQWQGSGVPLTTTLRIAAPIFDGSSVYAAGDYVYEYVIAVR